MVAARMPAMTTPANSGCISTEAMEEKIFSASEAVRWAVGSMARPMTPIITAADREITTHTVAIRRDYFSSPARRMAMNRSSTWGIPK